MNLSSIPVIDTSYRESNKDLRREKELSNGADPTPIHKFAASYGIPHTVANLLIGKTEAETEHNICTMSNAIDKYVARCIEEQTDISNKIQSAQTPYGWGRIDGNLVKIPEEQEVLDIMIRMHNENKSVSDTKEYLDGHNYPTRHNAEDGWQTCVISKILSRELERRGAK